jgi:hypothetical protein
MLPCNKRQTIVNRESRDTRFRCVNRDCEVFGHIVDEEACSVCPVRAFIKVPPCKKSKCKDCEPITDEVLAKALSSKGPIVEVKDEDTPDGKGVKDYPPMSLQLWNYKEALQRWWEAGRPTRTDEEVTQILNDFCHKCDWFDKDRKRCKGCGCRVTDGGFAVTNKVRMKTEKCPKGLW